MAGGGATECFVERESPVSPRGQLERSVSFAHVVFQPTFAHPYETSEAIDLLIRSGRTIDAIGLEGWRVDVGYPEDRDRAEALLRGEEPVAVEE